MLKSSFILDILIGGIFFAFCLLGGGWFLQTVYGFKGQLLREATIYLQVMSPYIFLTLLTFLFSNLLKIEQKTRAIFWIGLGSSLLDVALNYYLVPIYQIKGAAIAAMLSLLIIVLSYFLLTSALFFKSFTVKSMTKRELIIFGLPLTVQEILESVLFIMVFDALMGRQGVKVLAIYAVVSQLLSFVRIPAFVYSGSVAIFLPEAQKDRRTNQFIHAIYGYSFLVYLLCALFAVLLSNFLAQFLSTQIQTNTIPYTLFTMLIMLATPIYESSKMVLQSLEVVKMTIIVNITGILILMLIQLLNFQSYVTLYTVYGLTLVILSFAFIHKYKTYSKSMLFSVPTCSKSHK